MTTSQKPIGSGFGERSTAEEVLRGIDLTGKRAIVTGGYSGIGTVTVKELVLHGAHVVVPARRKETAEKELGGTKNVTIEELDLGDLESVRRFADRMLEQGAAIDLLINNAGIMACPETRIGPKKWEAQLATNHLGHYALTNRLWPLLAKNGARVVTLSSRGHKFSSIRFDDPMFEKEPYDKWKAYGQAKTANVLFSVGLDDRGKKAGVRAFAVHPGGIATPLVRHLSPEELKAMGMYDEHGNLHERFKTVEQGASTTLWAATSPKLEGMGAVYCEDGDVGALSVASQAMPTPGEKRPPLGVETYAIDHANADRLWEMSAELTGVDAFA